MLSPFITHPAGLVPHLGLVVSGGHSLLIDVKGPGDYTLLGRSRDDAAGEAFDKVAKMLDLPYPGGPEIDKLAEKGEISLVDGSLLSAPQEKIGKAVFTAPFSAV